MAESVAPSMGFSPQMQFQMQFQMQVIARLAVLCGKPKETYHKNQKRPTAQTQPNKQLQMFFVPVRKGKILNLHRKI